MIELARVSMEQIDDRLARLEAERVSLVTLRVAWERYLALGGTPSEQPEPGQGVPPASLAPAHEADDHRGEAGYHSHGAEPPSRESSPVASPIQQPSAGRAPAEQSGAAAPVSGSVDPPAVSRSCRHCEKPFAGNRGVLTHERWCLKNPDRERWEPTPVGLGGESQPPERPSSESFLCDRCQEPFPSRQALTEHRRGHPEIPIVPEPMQPAGGRLLPSAVARLG